MLVAKGAERFAVDLGFPNENLLTDDARKIWMLWKENNSQMDWWGPGMTSPHGKIPTPANPLPNPPWTFMASRPCARTHPPKSLHPPAVNNSVRASCPVTPRQNGQRPSASVRRS